MVDDKWSGSQEEGPNSASGVEYWTLDVGTKRKNAKAALRPDVK